MNIISKIKSRINNAKFERNVRRIKRALPARAVHFGWDPTDEWVQKSIEAIPTWTHCRSIEQMDYAAWRHFDPASYWTYEESGSARITARYTNELEPSPTQVASRAVFHLNTCLVHGKIERIVIGSHNTTLYWRGDIPAFTFVGYGRKAHGRSAFRAVNASKLIQELIGIELPWEEVIQPDLGLYNDITFLCNEKQVWEMSVAVQSHSA